MKQILHPTKIIRPHLPPVLLRERLFQIIDRLRSLQILWISGPGGSGKTTLVNSYIDSRKNPWIWYQIDESDNDLASFFHFLGATNNLSDDGEKVPLPHLTPEYMLGIQEFSRNYFSNYSYNLQQKSILVFDNCQEIKKDSHIFSAIVAGISRLDPKVSIVFISREEAPKQFAKLIANREMGLIGWKDIRLTREEFNDITKNFGIKIDQEQQSFVHKELDGWAAGLQLVSGTMDFHKRDSHSFIIGEESRERIFNYFAEEIFQNLEQNKKDILLKASLLPFISESLINHVCEYEDAFSEFIKLYKSNLFISQQSGHTRVFQFHQLFKEFLRHRCYDTISLDSIQDILNRAASILMENDLKEESAQLFIGAENWLMLSNLITEQAPELLKQGRFSTLQDWLQSIPQEVILKDPMLLFWSGMSLMLHSPEDARYYFSNALQYFEKIKNLPGIFLTLSGMGEALTYRFDTFVYYDLWIEKVEKLCGDFIDFPTDEIEARITMVMLTAIALRKPNHPNAEKWRSSAITILDQSPNKQVNDPLKAQLLNALILERILAGSLNEVQLYLETFRNIAKAREMAPIELITLKNFEALLAWRIGQFDVCQQSANDALNIARETGVHIISYVVMINGASGALSDGNLILAKKYLKRLEDQIEFAGAYVKQLYHISKVWYYILDNQSNKAIAQSERAVNLGEVVGNPELMIVAYLARAISFYNAQQINKAKKILNEAIEGCNNLNVQQMEFTCLLLKAEFDFDENDKKDALVALKEALKLGRKNGYINTPFWRPLPMAELCKNALENNIEIEYAKFLIQQRKLFPLSPPILTEEWPWPIRIYCLGRFEIVCNGETLKSTGKTQHKPIELLKLLITLGGRKVSKSLISDRLWPDADGDFQHQNFQTTLHRLRKILSIKNALIFQSGELTLNDRVCWVDVWSFERLTGEAEKALASKLNTNSFIQTAKKAIELYKKDYLQSDNSSFVITRRDELQSKYFWLVEHSARLSGSD